MNNRQIYINRSGQQYGPYPEATTREMLGGGKLLANDLAWAQGVARWEPLGDLLGKYSCPATASNRVSIPSGKQQAAIDGLSSLASESTPASSNSSGKSGWTYVPESVQAEGAHQQQRSTMILRKKRF
jgi:hypothetical protein